LCRWGRSGLRRLSSELAEEVKVAVFWYWDFGLRNLRIDIPNRVIYFFGFRNLRYGLCLRNWLDLWLDYLGCWLLFLFHKSRDNLLSLNLLI
jgi:hypothetical protein